MSKSDLIQELSQNFIEYAVAVNSDRSIPDSRSGLKPVARRILYGAYDTGRTSNKPHVKNARIVGDVMGSLHPHGDSSIYGALVRLSQEWVMRYPLIDFHGNKGNISGDGPAAYRYTEGRLAKISEDGLLAGLKKNNVDFIPNYDETMEEPVTLPAIFPNLLCNPNAGIGVAMACSWAPHNLNEVADAIKQYIAGEEPMLPGPDFPTGGLIVNKNDVPAIMKTGRGSVKIRAQYKIEKNDIVFYEIPYGETLEGLVAEIGKVCDEKEIEGVKEVQNQSNRKGIRIVLKCHKTADKERIIQQLFWKTKLQTSFSYNQVALVDKTPTELNLKDCCKIYIEHNIDCLKKELNYDLQKASDRLHIVEGLLIALEDIDNVIALIKASDNSTVAKENLMKKYSLSEAQAKSILAMRLSSLAKLEKLELENEKKELIDKIAEIKNILQFENLQINVIIERLDALVKKYGDPRRTELAQIQFPTKEEKEQIAIEPQKCVVVMTEDGYIKRIPTSSFKVQKRNGKGIKTQNDINAAIIRTNTVDSMMIFSNTGKMYRITVNDIPEGTNAQKGQPIKSLIQMESNEKPVLMYSIYKDSPAKFVLFATQNGMVKKTSLEEYSKTKKKTGLAAIDIKEGDALASVTLIGDEDVIVLTEKGMGIKFASTEISMTSRATKGMKGINLNEGDKVVGIFPIRDENDKIAIYSEKGLGKKMELSELPKQKRGGKGLVCYKTSDASGAIVGATLVNDSDLVLLVGSKNSICISAKDIPTLGRSSIGNQLLKGTVSSVSKV